MRPTAQTILIRFYDPDVAAADEKGRTLATMLAWDDETLEFTHDYIQTLFPLPEPSGARDDAPLITAEVQEAFMSRPELKQNLLLAFDRMLHFFGLEHNQVDSDDEEVERLEAAGKVTRVIHHAANFPDAAARWVKRHSHNHLRITRIIRCLRVLDCNDEAQRFYSFLELDLLVQERVCPESLEFWRRACDRPLRLPPRENDEDAVGTPWMTPVSNGVDHYHE